jgi:hypothetical protein
MNKTFFLDIFNKILKIGDKEIFIILILKEKYGFHSKV